MDKKVSVFVVSRNMNVLLLKTNPKKYETPYWSIINGGVDNLESFEDAAIRETIEETGLRIKKLFYSGFTSKYEYPKGNSREKKIFIGLVKSEEINLSEEHIDFKWISLDKLRGIFSWTESQEVLDKIIEKIHILLSKNEDN
jgi:8-oxo-dGTP pyrophosphatase MutT (NUDIX family)